MSAQHLSDDYRWNAVEERWETLSIGNKWVPSKPLADEDETGGLRVIEDAPWVKVHERVDEDAADQERRQGTVNFECDPA